MPRTPQVARLLGATGAVKRSVDVLAAKFDRVGRSRALRGMPEATPETKSVERDHESTPVEVRSFADGVLELRLVGPSQRNALGRATIDRIEQLVSIPPMGTRVVLLTADGPDFCAGYDLREAARGDAGSLIALGTNFAALKNAEIPVIAALHGNVIGGGLELALAADVRLATPDTKLALPAGRLGLVYSEEGIRLLVNEVGESHARAMLLAGKVLTAEDARASGVITEIVAPHRLEARALELASTVASWSELATSGNRRVLDVVVGRTTADTEALRRSSFAPGGTLAATIERFASADHDTAEASLSRSAALAEWASIAQTQGELLGQWMRRTWKLLKTRVAEELQKERAPRRPVHPSHSVAGATRAPS